MPSSDTIASGKALAGSCKILRTLEHLSTRINEVTRIADPVFYNNLLRLRAAVEKKHAVAECFNSIDPLAYEGREILFNRMSGIHTDSQDPHLAYAGLKIAGDFTSGGQLEIPDLDLRLRMLPGDFALIRGRVLKHGILPWDGGQRICIPHFTHTSLWRSVGLAHLVDINQLVQ